MKKIYLFFVLSALLSAGLGAQGTYAPMLVQGNQWNELSENISLPPEYQYEHTYITKLSGDTIIDGKTYYKLRKTTGAFVVENTMQLPTNNWETIGCIREDVANQKVYYKPNDKPEFLLYDFDVKEGDIIETYDANAPTIAVSVRIDTINTVVIDGQVRKQICVLSLTPNSNCLCSMEHKWIEGTGCLEGLLNSTQAQRLNGGERTSLLCFSQNGNLVYKQKPSGTDIEDCYVWRYRPLPPETGQIDSVSLKSVTNENAEYVVHSSLLGGYDDYSVQYQETDNSEIKVKILYSQSNLSNDYTSAQAAINIPKTGFLRASVETYIRYKIGGTNEEPEYTDYRQVGEAGISLVGSDIATAKSRPKAVKSVKYYNLTGKPVGENAKGFVIRKTVYDDDSLENSKIMR